MNHINHETVLEALSHHIGKAQGIHAKDLVVEITRCYPAEPGQERQLRHVIEELRREGHHICGKPSQGYFMAADESELVETCEYLVSRLETGYAQIAAMRRVSVPDLRGQLRLPT